ncbi:Unknown protein [Striga hermonthica]|uniref:Uncharacterized protein n=1 Tax=Striga hermonthica TaxID=68872 RepID=A0A9N7REP2_STRHE|nr:Unknown protein [Striga hermonthica]
MIFQEESLEPFDFLAIGTFGMELRHTDPPTPTLTTPHENWTYPQTEITENDLELVNYELEKFLEAGEKEIAYDTSGRSSQASIITLSHAIPEGADSDSQVHTMAHPLQNYLFATLIDRTETDEGVTKEKTAPRGHFKENNMTHDKHTKIREGSEQRSRKVSHFMKKMVKKFNSSSRCSKDSSKKDAAVSISIKKRLSKATKMFDRKVRPEEMTDKQFTKVEKNTKKRISGEHENKMIGQDRSKWSGRETREPSSNGTYMGASTTNGEHWIKTDSDCK